VLCKLGGGARDDGSGREELGWVEQEKEEVITTTERCQSLTATRKIFGKQLHWTSCEASKSVNREVQVVNFED